MYSVLWLVAVIVFLVLEASTYQFVCIWFSGGALGGLIASLFGANPVVQVIVFFVLSAVLLAFTRPFVKKVTANRQIKTNVEQIPGQIGRVIETVDNVNGTGIIKIGAMDWTARSVDDTVIEKGAVVNILEISGVKAIVEEVKEEKGE